MPHMSPSSSGSLRVSHPVCVQKNAKKKRASNATTIETSKSPRVRENLNKSSTFTFLSGGHSLWNTVVPSSGDASSNRYKSSGVLDDWLILVPTPTARPQHKCQFEDASKHKSLLGNFMSSALQSQEGLLILAELAEKYLTCQVIWLHSFAYPLRST